MSNSEQKNIVGDELSLDDILNLYEQTDDTAGLRKNPFKFLDAFGPEDQDIFFGRDLEIDVAMRHYLRRKHFVLYGESGSGKSSLIQCGLRSKIAEEDAIFIPIRCHRDPFVEIRHQLEDIASISLPRAFELGEMIDQATEKLNCTIVLFFDQFEEFFLFHPPKLRKEFAEALAKLLTSKLNLKIVFAIRQEYLAQLTELETVVPSLFENKLWLRRMSSEDAAQAVHDACNVCEVKIEPGLVGQILDRLAPKGKGVELPYLQVVMDRLYHKAQELNSEAPELTISAYRKEGEISDILAQFLEEEIDQLDTPEQGRQLLKAMVTTDGTRRVLGRVTISAEVENFGAQIPDEVLDRILHHLAETRILLEDPQHNTFELRHDTLAKSVHKWISGMERELMEVRSRIENRFQEFNSRGQTAQALLDQDFLDYLAPYLSRLKLSETLSAFVESSRAEILKKARKKLKITIGGVSAIFIVLLIFSFWNMKERAQATKYAQDVFSRNLADKSRQLLHTNPRLSLLLAGEAVAKDKRDHGKVSQEAEELLREVSATAGGSVALSGSDKAIAAVRISDNGKWLAATDIESNVLLWDLEKQANHSSPSFLKGHTAQVLSLAFSPDGRWLATAGRDHTIRLWDLTLSNLKQSGVVLHGHGTTVYSIAFSPDGKWLASGSGDYTIRLWDMTASIPQQHSTILTGHNSLVFSLSFSPGGRWLATGSLDHSLKLWDMHSEAVHIKPIDLSRVNSPVMSLTFSPDEHWLAAGHVNGIAVLWDIKQFHEVMQSYALSGHEGIIADFAFSADSQWLATAGVDKTARLWDLSGNAPGEKPYVLEGHSAALSALAFHPSGKWLTTASLDGTVRLWDILSYGDSHKNLYGFAGAVSSLAFSKNGDRLVAGSADNTIRVWSFNSPSLAPGPITLPAHEGPITALAFSPDGNTLFSGSSDKSVKVWDLSLPMFSPHPLTLVGHNGPVTALAFNPITQLLVTAGPKDVVRTWEYHQQNMVATPEKTITALNDITEATFSPDGKWLVIIEKAPSKAWLMSTLREQVGNLMPLLDGVALRKIYFSPDNRWLAVVGWDNTFHVQQLKEDETMGNSYTMRGHSSIVDHLAFSPQGNWLVSTDYGQQSLFWHLEDGRPTRTSIPPPLMTSLLSATSKASQTHATTAEQSDTSTWQLVKGEDSFLQLHFGVQQQNGQEPQPLFPGLPKDIYRGFFSTDQRRLVVATSSNDYYLIELPPTTNKFEDTLTLKPHSLRFAPAPIINAGFTNNGTVLLTVHADGTLYYLDLSKTETWSTAEALPGSSPGVSSLSINTNADLLLLVQDGKLQFRDFSTSAQQHRFPVTEKFSADDLTEAAFTNKDELIVFTKDGVFEKKDLAGASQYRQKLTTDYLQQLAKKEQEDLKKLQKRSKKIMGEQNRLQLQPLSRAEQQEFSMQTIWSADGSRAASLEAGRRIAVFDLQKENPPPDAIDFKVSTFIAAIALDPKGRWLAIGQTSGKVGLLDLRQSTSKEDIVWLEGHDKKVSQLCFSPDSQWLATGGEDGMIRLFPVDRADLAAAACQAAGSPLTSAEWQEYLGEEFSHNACNNEAQ
jgi:WD40 repeat protein